MARPLAICFAAAEVAPFSKTGGLADVASALPARLHRLGHDVRVFTPLYGAISREGREFAPVGAAQRVEVGLGPRTFRFSLRTAPLTPGGPPVLFVDCPELFGGREIYGSGPDEARRFGLLCRALFESCQRLRWSPDVLHCNDWHTALLPLLRRTVYDWDELFHRSRSLLTIHNLGYQGLFGAAALDALGLRDRAPLFDQQDLREDRVNLLRTGLLYADRLSTVSPTYAREIQTDGYGMGLGPLLRARAADLVGILNGVDYLQWSPEHDEHIPYRYTRGGLQGKRENKLHLLRELGLGSDPDLPLVGVVSRLVEQKGFELCVPVLPELLAEGRLRLAVLGSGEAKYEEFFAALQARFPGRAVFYRGYNEALAHLIEAGADLFLMPSRYEPCGLNQLFSLRYGTIPVVRRTGGLADSVRPFDPARRDGTGFAFDHFTPEGLAWALRSALSVYGDREAWAALMDNAMAEDFSWETQADHYVELYRSLVAAD